MKTYISHILTMITTVLVMNLFSSCNIDFSGIKWNPVTPENNSGIPFEIIVEEISDYVLYPNLNAETVAIPFTIIAEEKLDTLSINVSTWSESKAVCELADDYMSGIIYVSATEELIKHKPIEEKIIIKGESGRNWSRTETIIRVATIRCSTKNIKFSSAAEDREINLTANVPYEVRYDDTSKDYLKVIEKEDKVFVHADENTEFAERHGTVTFTDPKGYLDDITINITQKESYGSRQRDSLALVKLYNDWDMKESEYTGMNGPMDYWCTDAPLEKWLGISCYSGRVRTFDITLRKWTSNWEPYKYEIGETIGELRMLRQIFLAAQLVGDLPQSLGQLTELKEVEIYGPNMITGNLENHPIGKLAGNFKYFCVDGFFEGSLPEWLADIKEWRCDNTVCSGKMPDRVAEHEMMTFIYPNRCNDGTVEWPFINQDAQLKKVDQCTVVIALTSHYALWCGDTMPDGVIKVNGKFGKHYEWISQEALLNYLETTRGYSDIRKNLSSNVFRDHPAWENQYREAAGLKPLDYANGIDW